MILHLAGRGERPGSVASGALVVCPDEGTRLDFREAGFETVLADGNIWALPAESSARRFCCELAGSWYRDLEGRDFTVVDGVSLGAALEGVLWSVRLAPIYDLLYRLQVRCRRSAPESIRAGAGVPAWRRGVAAALAARLGVRGPDPAGGASERPPALAAAVSWHTRAHYGARRALDAVLSRLQRGERRWLVSYYDTLEPFLEALAARRDISPAYYGWPGRRWLRQRGWWRWRCPVPAGALPADLAALEPLNARWRVLREDPAYQARFRYEGDSCWPQVRAALDAAVSEDFPILLEESGRVRALLDEVRPERVVVPFDASPPERLLVHECRRRAVPTAVVMHGAPTVPTNPLMDTQADALLVGGPGYIDNYAAAGVRRERIKPVGHPLLERARAARRAPGGARPRVLLVSAMLPIEENIGRVLDLLGSRGVETTVKLHPGESVTLYRRLLAGRLGPSVRLAAREDFIQVARRADLVIGGASTALLEVMAMGVPVLLTNFEGSEFAAPFDGKWELRPHRSAEELDSSLRLWLPDRLPRTIDYSRTLEAFFGPEDGRCADRILEALGA